MKIDKNYLYSGGLAEFVSKPTHLTFTFFRHWFTGKQSVGKAMDLLKLPYQPLSAPLLVLIEDELYVNLKTEEETLYHDTIFIYKPQTSIHTAPQQRFTFSKILLPDSWSGTFQHIGQQSYWLGHQSEVLSFIDGLIQGIPEKPTQSTIDELDAYMAETIWPAVIAISMINEFFLAVAAKDHVLQTQTMQDAMNRHVVAQDWFFQSIVKMRDVKAGLMSFDSFLKEYGLRADKDYELCSPRWEEIPDQMKIRINNLIDVHKEPHVQQTPEPLSGLAETVVATQIARITIKKKALSYIYQLRKLLLAKYKKDDLSAYTRSLVLYGKNEVVTSEHVNLDEEVSHKSVKDSGVGSGVSKGVARGVTQHINDATETIQKGAVCIFPNTSPEFSPYYKKCSGIIFMKGGVTSHGAIVAREYGIPAIVYPDTFEIPGEMLIEIDGKAGTWTVV